MAQEKSSKETGIQEVLMDAVEVQLAAFKAGIDFWGGWVKVATEFSNETSKRLGKIRSNPSDAKRLLLEITDVSREGLRGLNELPRQAAERFVEEMEKSSRARKAASKPGPRPKPKRPVKAKP
ncbi:MAG: hypothetical protein JSU77_06800 [Fidelibacterota bacterium]|nr:MAG: hypothetical protein JSU77_06800 [Candidatus Neomarinimicrobiota bacterium]